MMCINQYCLDSIQQVLSLVMIIIQSIINRQINSQLPVSSMDIKKKDILMGEHLGVKVSL